MDKLKNRSITSEKLSNQSITSEKLATEAVRSYHITHESIHPEHIVNESLTEEKLSFNPVQTVKGSTNTLQQCGIVPFEFTDQDETVEIVVQLDEPYFDENYVLVAMTNHPACYSVLNELTQSTAVIRITRHKFTPKPYGIVHWIAMGRKQV